jgi:hypothetical protein
MTRQQKPKTPAQPIPASEKLAIPRHCGAWAGEPTIDPRYYRGHYWEGGTPCPPANRWTPASRAAYEARVAWFHKARYGIMFHFTANSETTSAEVSASGWTSEKWNVWVDAIDVDKVADQAKEAGAGYVMMCITQVGQYHCAPNPVLEKYWGLKPGQFSSRRDLPMDLSRALAKRGLRMMLYTHAALFYGLPLPRGMDKATAYRRWLEVMQWDSDHYGKAVSGWWVDGPENFVPDYVEGFHAALRHGNPDTLIGDGYYELSDYLHGHCNPDNWAMQQKILPYFGRWEPEYNIQWHQFQFLGPSWGQPGVAHTTPDMVRYMKKIAAGGGVMTFDLGVHDGKGRGPLLEIADDQMAQLCAIRDALKDVPLTDGADMRQKTLERLLMTVKDEFIQLHAAWPLHWSDTFALKAPQGIQIRGNVEDGVLVELAVTPPDRRKDIKLPGQNGVYDARSETKPFTGPHVVAELKVETIKAAPKLDGTLDDAAWKAAAMYTAFKTESCDESRTKTKLYIAQDDKALYLAIECFEDAVALKHLKAEVKDHNGHVWEDDSVEVFFDPAGEKKGFYQIVINSKGTTHDSCCVGDGNPQDWKPTYQSAAKVGKESWVAEFAFPWSIFTKTPKMATTWGFNIKRNRVSGDDEKLYFAPMKWPFPPAKFGKLTNILLKA